MLIEIDCPYLSPYTVSRQAQRTGLRRRGGPCLANFYDVELEAMASVTSDNFRRFFRLSSGHKLLCKISVFVPHGVTKR